MINDQALIKKPHHLGGGLLRERGDLFLRVYDMFLGVGYFLDCQYLFIIGRGGPAYCILYDSSKNIISLVDTVTQSRT